MSQQETGSNRYQLLEQWSDGSQANGSNGKGQVDFTPWGVAYQDRATTGVWAAGGSAAAPTLDLSQSPGVEVRESQVTAQVRVQGAYLNGAGRVQAETGSQRDGWMTQGAYSTEGLELYSQACFVAGTPLLTPAGSKRIEEFRPGDLLLSRNERDPEGAVTPKAVEEVFHRFSPVLTLTVGDRAIGTTAEHPFWVCGKGWLSAGDIMVGDHLLSHDGRSVVVSVKSETGEWAAVYNLRVADFHTYFVGCSEWGWSVWAHNQYTEAQKTKLGMEVRVQLSGLNKVLGYEKAEALKSRIMDIGRVAPKEGDSAKWAEYWTANGSKNLQALATKVQNADPEHAGKVANFEVTQAAQSENISKPAKVKPPPHDPRPQIAKYLRDSFPDALDEQGANDLANKLGDKWDPKHPEEFKALAASEVGPESVDGLVAAAKNPDPVLVGPKFGPTVTPEPSSWKAHYTSLLKAAGVSAAVPTAVDTRAASLGVDVHAHHIVMKSTNESWTSEQGQEANKAILDSQALLEKHNIDWYAGPENLVWAPNTGHTQEYAISVWNDLDKVAKQAAANGVDENGTKQMLADELQRIGGLFAAGKYPVAATSGTSAPAAPAAAPAPVASAAH